MDDAEVRAWQHYAQACVEHDLLAGAHAVQEIRALPRARAAVDPAPDLQ